MSAVWPHLPALQVVVPLIGALLAGFLRRGGTAFALALAVSWITPVIAIAMLLQVLASGPISYHLGGWEPPWGIEYRVDSLNAFFLVLVSVVGAVIMPFARRSVAFEIEDWRQAWFYCMYLLCLTGLLGIAITGDAFNAFVFLEISSLSTYVLIALGPDRRALVAAFQYLIMGTIGATFYVIGVGLLYLLTGTLNMVDMADAPRAGLAGAVANRRGGAGVRDGRRQSQARACSRSTPGCRTPMPMRRHGRPRSSRPPQPRSRSICWSGFSSRSSACRSICVPCRSVRSLSRFRSRQCSLRRSIAVFESNLKRMLAYSSVAQIGYITLGIGLANQAGLTGGLVHVVNHALMKAALFLAVGAIFYRGCIVQSGRACRHRPQDAAHDGGVHDRGASVSSVRRARRGSFPNGIWPSARSIRAGGYSSS